MTWFRVNISITDGKSTAVTKEYYFNVEDTLDDGALVVSGKLMSGSHSISGATVWQDLDNDGVLDAGETSVTTNIYGDFSVSLSKSDTDAPIVATGGTLSGSGLENKALLKINSNLKTVLNRDWGEYSLTPTSSISLSMQNLDRSISDKQSTLDIQKAFGLDPLWHEGDGNFYGGRFYDIKNNINLNSSINDWEAFNLNIYTLNNLLTVLGNTYSKAAVQIITDALSDVNSAVSSTPGVSGYSAGILTSAQIDSIEQAAYQALYDAVAEAVSGKSAYDGFRLSDKSPVTITDHEGSTSVLHTPAYSVSDGTLTLNTNSEISRSDLQSSLTMKLVLKHNCSS